MQTETVFDPALPEFCLTVVPSAGTAECVRAIHRGVSGYCATTYRVKSIEEGQRLAADMNQKLGISPEMHDCMVVGSMFGWEVPGAQLPKPAVQEGSSCPEVTNQQRADWAATAVRAFAAETGLDVSGDETETAIADLIADLMHLCDKEGIDFDVALMRGRSHYREELADERRVRAEQGTPDADAGTHETHCCDNCGKLHSSEMLVLPVKHLHQRVEPGGAMPSGECADCGCLCYPEEAN